MLRNLNFLKYASQTIIAKRYIFSRVESLSFAIPFLMEAKSDKMNESNESFEFKAIQLKNLSI